VSALIALCSCLHRATLEGLRVKDSPWHGRQIARRVELKNIGDVSQFGATSRCAFTSTTNTRTTSHQDSCGSIVAFVVPHPALPVVYAGVPRRSRTDFSAGRRRSFAWLGVIRNRILKRTKRYLAQRRRPTVANFSPGNARSLTSARRLTARPLRLHPQSPEVRAQRRRDTNDGSLEHGPVGNVDPDERFRVVTLSGSGRTAPSEAVEDLR